MPTDKIAALSDEQVIHQTRNWLEKAVIGLNLCPFAKAVHVKQQIRYVVSDARDTVCLLSVLADELTLLAASDPVQLETTLLIHPQVLGNFLDYNDFLAVADRALAKLNLVGVIQIASFHPDYQFADSDPTDLANYTNRAPFAILHLLREASITQAVQAFPDASEIFEKNIETLRKIEPAALVEYGFAAVTNSTAAGFESNRSPCVAADKNPDFKPR